MASTRVPAVPRPLRKMRLQTVSDGRHAALEVVLLLEQGALVQAALDRYLRGASLKPQDRALCTELVYGFLRTEIRIDHLLQGVLRDPKKLPREMYLALGLALYALLFLERIPAHATVDWTVGHVRRRFGDAMSKVANGALRTVVRLSDAPKHRDYYCRAGAGPAAAVYADALFYSLPVWVVKLWDKAYGPELCRALCQRSLRAPYTGVRVNALSSNAVELHTALVSLSAHDPDAAVQVGYGGLAFAAGRSPRSVANAPLSYWQQQGDISFQSAGSQCVMQALAPQSWPSPVWDICAGQGGKSAILLEQGVVVALCSDVHGQRLESFTGNMQRLASTFGQVAQVLPDPANSGAKSAERINAVDDAGGAVGCDPTELSLCPSAALPLATFCHCALPDSSVLMAARAQALRVLETVEKAHGQKVQVITYPAVICKKQTHDDDYDADFADANLEDDDLEVCIQSGKDAESAHMFVTDIREAGHAADHAHATTGHFATHGACSSVARAAALHLPLVAVFDGCFAPLDSWSGTICIDAPCSGLGILSRRPDIRRHRSADSVAELIALQAQLLDSAWQALQVGGGLVYMTCTLNPAENENQILRLLDKYPNARLVRQWQTDHQHPWLEGMFGAYCVKDALVP